MIINGDLFVHAGVCPDGDLESLTAGTQIDYNGTKKHLWIREHFYNYKYPKFLDKYGVKRIVFGHSPIRYISKNDVDKMTPLELLGGKLLAIDCGSCYKKTGGICVVELTNDSYEIAGISYNS